MLFILVAAIANVSANLILKYSGVSLATSVMGQFAQPAFFGALMLWGINMLFYSRAVQYVHVSVAYATLVALTVVLLTLMSWMLFHDGVSSQKWLGIGLIVIGVIVIYWQ